MDKITKDMIDRLYQSYLSGGDVYTYKFESSSEIKKMKYDKALKYLEENGIAEIRSRSDDRVKLVLTDKGVEYCNSMDL